jgi:CO/xanthine dehydrogenase FAD-binding subunit
MRPVLFPTTLADLFEMQARYPEARLMAGGTDLLVHLRKAAFDTRALICLERMGELKTIQAQSGQIVVGAAASLADVARHPLIQRHCLLLARAAATVGGPAIRNMATLGGNICTASPAGDTLPALYLLGARLDLASPRGRRSMPIDAFITGPGRTVLAPGELLTAIRIPAADAFIIQHFEKVGRRNAMAIAVASLAALIRMDGAGRVAEARLAWGSVGPCVVRCNAAEHRLVGGPLSTEALCAAGEPVRQSVRPIDDIRATADYRRTLAANLLLRIGTP